MQIVDLKKTYNPHKKADLSLFPTTEWEAMADPYHPQRQGGSAVGSQQGTEKQDEITAFEVRRQGRGEGGGYLLKNIYLCFTFCKSEKRLRCS